MITAPLLHMIFFHARLRVVSILQNKNPMPEKILIVDDEVDSLKLIGLMLQRNDYEVVAANNGSQAITKALAELPDLIILDVMMPDMDGYEVCRRLRSRPETKAIPIIMFTAKTLIDDKVAGFEAGADDYLTKPTHPAELASRVQAILERTADRRAKAGGGRSHGRMTIGVLGTKGGIGTTTLAVNIAAAFKQLDQNPILADFRLGVGNLGLMLGFDHTEGMAHLLSKPIDEIDNNTIQREIVSHQTGLQAVLSSTYPREGLIAYSPKIVNKVIKGLGGFGEPVILDLGNGYTSLFKDIQNNLHQLVLVLEPTSISVTMAYDMLEELERSFKGQIHVVVVNRYHGDGGHTGWQEIENALKRQIRAIISGAPDLIYESTESGVPIINIQPNAIISGEIMKLTEAMNVSI